ncbi:MAG: hypothetical protein WA999_05460, partial [Spirulinaceae cyanobacterium]
MNTQKALLSLLAIPSLLFASPSLSATNTNLETEVRQIQQQTTELAQAPDYQYYESFILQEISGALVGKGEFEQALRVLSRKETDQAQSTMLQELMAVEAAKVGKFDLALQAANSMETGSSKAYALEEVAFYLAKAGEVERALQVLASLPEEEQKPVRGLGAVVSSLAEAGEVERALQIARSVADKQDQAVLLAQTGALEEALQLIKTLTASQQMKTLDQMAWALAHMGKFEQALELAQSLPRGSFQGRTFSNISTTLANAGKFEQALEIAELIQTDYTQEDADAEVVAEEMNTPNYRSGALFNIANALTEAGKLEQALQIAQSVQIEDGQFISYQQQSITETVAKELAIAGDFDKALEVASVTETSYDETLVAIELAKAGKLKQATEIAASLEDEYYKVDILREVAAQLTKAGKLNEAKEIAQSVEDEQYQSLILIRIVQALADLGKVEEALQLAQQAPEGRRIYVIGGVAETVALTDFERAIDILQSLENNEAKSQVVTNMAKGLAVDGQVDKALQLTESVEIPYYNPASANLLRTAAVNFAKLGDFERALEIAQSIDESYRWRTIGDIAIELAAVGEVEQSLALAESVDQYQDDLLTIIASKFVEAGKVEQALALTERKDDASFQAKILVGVVIGLGTQGDFNRALTIAQSIEDESVKAVAMGQIAGELIKAKQFNKGMEVTQYLNQSVGDNNSKAFALQGIGASFASEKQFDFALQVVEMLDFQPEDENPIVVSGLREGVLQAVAIFQA